MFLPILFVTLNWAFVGLPVAGNPVEDLVGAIAAGAESVGAGHGRNLRSINKVYIFKLAGYQSITM